MGAWGTAVFSDDLAADVRGEWRELLLAGADPGEATARIKQSFTEALEDPDEGVVFWLAFAAAQMETGRLADNVRDRALEIIDRGGDIARWEAEDPSLARQRQRALESLATKLRGPQPKPKRLRRARPLGVEFELGDVVLVRGADGSRRALAVVVDQEESYPPDRREPVVELLAWGGEGEIPSDRQLHEVPFLRTVDDLSPRPSPHRWVIATPRKADTFGPEIGEVVARGIRRSPSADYGTESYLSWQTLALYVGADRFVEDLRRSGLEL